MCGFVVVCGGILHRCVRCVCVHCTSRVWVSDTKDKGFCVQPLTTITHHPPSPTIHHHTIPTTIPSPPPPTITHTRTSISAPDASSRSMAQSYPNAATKCSSATPRLSMPSACVDTPTAAAVAAWVCCNRRSRACCRRVCSTVSRCSVVWLGGWWLVYVGECWVVQVV